MIFLATAIYILVSMIISFLLRKIFSSRILKILIFNFSFALMCTFWFSYPGSNYLSPITSSFAIALIEANDFNTLRLLRPFLVIFLISSLIDILINLFKARNI
tara:strand:- start:976 stop:1284 length:309 start_codon:yes stop_codon:yes gene_type:complete